MTQTQKLIERLIFLGVVFTHGVPTTTMRMFKKVHLALEYAGGEKSDIVKCELEHRDGRYFAYCVEICSGVRKTLAADTLVFIRGSEPGTLEVWTKELYNSLKKDVVLTVLHTGVENE